MTDDELIPYIGRGRDCDLAGLKAGDMTQEQLIGFVGFLDEHVAQLTVRLRQATLGIAYKDRGL